MPRFNLWSTEVALNTYFFTYEKKHKVIMSAFSLVLPTPLQSSTNYKSISLCTWLKSVSETGTTVNQIVPPFIVSHSSRISSACLIDNDSVLATGKNWVQLRELISPHHATVPNWDLEEVPRPYKVTSLNGSVNLLNLLDPNGIKMACHIKILQPTKWVSLCRSREHHFIIKGTH